ncbi:thioredoxin family protein [Streptomyces sp. MJM1172]|uniref:thioredoxin family protein n=1 Tax=Streptomyces sp. MJM1172 TaxID=1703926 RepID=UPI001F51F3DF|nr:thioredoxin family protein [Streptomyces sp. MJM1172]
MVFFGASWCRPCKAAYPLTERMASEFGVPLEYVDVEYGDDRARDVTAIPTVRVYDVHDEVVMEVRGNVSQGALDALFGGLA